MLGLDVNIHRIISLFLFLSFFLSFFFFKSMAAVIVDFYLFICSLFEATIFLNFFLAFS